MKYIRILTVLAFLASFGGYRYLYGEDVKKTDTTPPVITVEKETLKISVNKKTSALLKGVTAADDRDGDLTGEIVVENVGPFLSDMTRQVTYVVCDSAYNTARAARSITYKDYEAPRFSLSDSPVFSVSQEADPLSLLSASDVLDGDVTNLIQQTEGIYNQYSKPGLYDVSYQVTNSAGDMSSVSFSVFLVNSEEYANTPMIGLKERIVYLKKGKSFDPCKYLENVMIGSRIYEIDKDSRHVLADEEKKVYGLFGSLNNREPDDELIETISYRQISCESNVDSKKPGTYQVLYSVKTQDGYTGYISLPVIVYK